jgi:hypothetical protein
MQSDTPAYNHRQYRSFDTTGSKYVQSVHNPKQANGTNCFEKRALWELSNAYLIAFNDNPLLKMLHVAIYHFTTLALPGTSDLRGIPNSISIQIQLLSIMFPHWVCKDNTFRTSFLWIAQTYLSPDNKSVSEFYGHTLYLYIKLYLASQ